MDAPTVCRFSLMEDATTDGAIELVGYRPQVLELIVSLKEAAEGSFSFTLVRCALPAIAEGLQSFNHQATHGDHREAVPFRIVEDGIKIPLIEAPADHIGDS